MGRCRSAVLARRPQSRQRLGVRLTCRRRQCCAVAPGQRNRLELPGPQVGRRDDGRAPLQAFERLRDADRGTADRAKLVGQRGGRVQQLLARARPTTAGRATAATADRAGPASATRRAPRASPRAAGRCRTPRSDRRRPGRSAPGPRALPRTPRPRAGRPRADRAPRTADRSRPPAHGPAGRERRSRGSSR